MEATGGAVSGPEEGSARPETLHGKPGADAHSPK
jgi:hypothetical protein